MLKDILRMAEEGSLVHGRDMARRVGVSERVLHEILADLVQRGYLRSPTDSSEPSCGGCAMHSACTPGGSRLWCLTPKGRAALQ
jgi:hypothetical protein